MTGSGLKFENNFLNRKIIHMNRASSYADCLELTGSPKSVTGEHNVVTWYNWIIHVFRISARSDDNFLR